MSDTQAQADDRRAQIQARLDAVKQAYRDGGLNVLVKPSHLASWDDIEWLLAERDRLSRQLDKAQAEATDWQLAADGWTDQKLVLYVDPNVSFGGKITGG